MNPMPFTARLRAPVTTSFGIIDERRGFFIGDRDAVCGEATPLPAFGTETLEVCERVLRADGDDGAFAPCARHALEQLRITRRGDAVSQLALHAGVHVSPATIENHTLCGNDLDEILDRVAAGVRTIKLKLTDVERDRHLLRQLRWKVSPAQLAIRLDANAGLDLPSARWLLRSLARGDVEFLEQPLPAHDVEGLRMLAAEHPHVTLCADESLIDETRRRELLAAPEPLGFIWKPQAIGGALAVIDAVKARPDRVHVVTGFFDTAVAQAYAVACARVVDALTGVARAHGLASCALVLAPSPENIDGGSLR